MLRKLLVITALLLAYRPVMAAEICGNAQDDDADGIADEGCLAQQCESPLSCSDTGMVSPSTGSLHYTLPPDVAPHSPWGPALGFRRHFQSMFSPGVGAPAFQKALGERWGHSYSSWLTKRTSENPVQVILHTTRGQDVLSKFLTTLSGWDYYSFQPTGFHVQHLRQRTTSPNEYQLKLLTGETMVFNSSGRLVEIWDTLATPNKVLLAYDGNAQLSTVTDATGKRRLLFQYDPVTARMTSVAFQLFLSSAWATQHTTTYGYTGLNMTSVTIGGQLAQTNVYDAAGYLTQIKDAENNAIVSFAYNATTLGRVDRVDTARGMVGFELASTRTNCSGKTVLYFNRGNSTSCSTDTDPSLPT